jgi:5S rRNA maturation endonuclease (ribonuclease M5)
MGGTGMKRIVIIEGNKDLAEVYENAAVTVAGAGDAEITVFQNDDSARSAVEDADVVVLDHDLPGAGDLADNLLKSMTTSVIITTTDTGVVLDKPRAYITPGFEDMKRLISKALK